VKLVLLILNFYFRSEIFLKHVASFLYYEHKNQLKLQENEKEARYQFENHQLTNKNIINLFIVKIVLFLYLRN
jgi:hypothetical protein